MAATDDVLTEIYRTALYRTTPAILTRQALERPELQELLGEPLSVICLGKCASGMFKGVAASVSVLEGFAAYPAEYVQDAFPPFVDVVQGTHPEMSEGSFEAGDALVKFAERCGEFQVLVLLSGGTSASMAKPLAPFFTREDLVYTNRVLIDSGLPIEKINTVRKHLSAIKGGRLGAMLPAGTVTLVLSDVSRGAWHDVGSGPTLPDTTTNGEAAKILQGLGDAECDRLAAILLEADVPETPRELPGHESFLMGDSWTLVQKTVEIASKAGFDARAVEEELNSDVDEVAERLDELMSSLSAGEMLVAGGEATVRVKGEGRGGRCSEMAVRLGERLRRRGDGGGYALLASSDGVDGETDAAGYVVSPHLYGSTALSEAEVGSVLDVSDSLSIAEEYAVKIAKNPTGNNLRDLFILTRA